MPDIALEIVVSNPLVDTLAVYAGLGVPEVWVWRPTTSTIASHRVVGDRYELSGRRGVLPDLDVAELAGFVHPGEDQTQLAKDYQARLQSR